MKKIPNFPKYRQELGDGRIRIVTIITYGKHQATAACKEFKEGHEGEPDNLIYYKSYKRTTKGESINELKQMAKDFYGVKEDQLIKS